MNNSTKLKIILISSGSAIVLLAAAKLLAVEPSRKDACLFPQQITSEPLKLPKGMKFRGFTVKGDDVYFDLTPPKAGERATETHLVIRNPQVYDVLASNPEKQSWNSCKVVLQEQE